MTWRPVCRPEDILPNTGVCALVAGQQVAIFRVGEQGKIYALGNFDPIGKAFVLSRGIVGDRGGRAKVASPLFKHNFDLQTGQCLDDATVKVPVFATRIANGQIEVLDDGGIGS